MSIETILQYIFTTPENTNPAILIQMLKELTSSSTSSQAALNEGETYAAAADVVVTGAGKVAFVYDESKGTFTKVIGT